MPRVLTGTTVISHPEQQVPVLLREGDDLPDWAEGLVGDHLLSQPADASTDPAPDASVEPARGGPKATLDAWTAHAQFLGLTVPVGASRADVMALVDAHKAAADAAAGQL